MLGSVNSHSSFFSWFLPGLTLSFCFVWELRSHYGFPPSMPASSHFLASLLLQTQGHSPTSTKQGLPKSPLVSQPGKANREFSAAQCKTPALCPPTFERDDTDTSTCSPKGHLPHQFPPFSTHAPPLPSYPTFCFSILKMQMSD